MGLTLIYPNGQLLRDRDPHLWRAVDDDPQLNIRRFPGGPRYVVVELEAVDAPLSPCVYLSSHIGFDEERRVLLSGGSGALVVIDLAGSNAAHGARLDPNDVRGVRFRMRWWRRRSRAGLRSLLLARMRAHPDLAPEIVGGGETGVFDGFGARLRSFGGGLAADLDGIWALAKAMDPPPPPAGVEISFLAPIYNTPAEHLETLLGSFLQQAPGAELILSDDGSTRTETLEWLIMQSARSNVTVLRNPENRGIAAATNAALERARGTWIGLIDHDDALAPHAIAQLRRAIRGMPMLQFLYTDEVIADAAMKPISTFLKPAFDPVLLSGVNYVNHLSLYRAERLRALGGLSGGFHGSQDYELLMRYCRGLTASEIAHLPYPAYVWRQHADSASHAGVEGAVAAARRALALHMAPTLGPIAIRPALQADLHRVDPQDAPRPSISAIVPNRDSPKLISRVLADILEGSDRPDETIVVDNGSVDPETLALYRRYEDQGNLRVDITPEPFNFARMVNRGAAMARSDTLLLLNNDIAVLEPGWLTEMTHCLRYPGVGIVGARLLYPDRRLQHAGVVLGLGGYAGHWFYKAAEDAPGPMGRLQVRNSMTVVTAACMLVTRACWEAVGGMDEETFAVAYNDVDLCARARAAGFGVVWTPFATLMHHESVSRGSDMFGAPAARFAREKAALAMRHGTADFEDPCYNPWWSRWHSEPRLQRRTTLPAARIFMGMADWK